MSKYSIIKDADMELRLVSLTGAVDIPVSLRDLLTIARYETDASMFAFEAPVHGLFVVWVSRTWEISTNREEDGLEIISQYLQQSEHHPLSLLINLSSLTLKDLEAQTSSSMLLVIQQWTTIARKCLALSDEATLALDYRTKRHKSDIITLLGPANTWSRCWKGKIWLSVIVVLGLMVAFFSILRMLDSRPNLWARYDIKGSIGPRYQLQFTHHNVTEWTSQNPHENGEWALRIDDQAMIPAHLLDEEEIRYQKWYQERYPEMNEVRQKHLYVNETFLGDPAAIQVPSDKTFHMSHCVRALRRYWQAKETGHHVCPRDIDFRHMKHCLDALDEWAFPPGKRMENQGMHEVNNWVLIWETKVCFD